MQLLSDIRCGDIWQQSASGMLASYSYGGMQATWLLTMGVRDNQGTRRTVRVVTRKTGCQPLIASSRSRPHVLLLCSAQCCYEDLIAGAAASCGSAAFPALQASEERIYQSLLYVSCFTQQTRTCSDALWDICEQPQLQHYCSRPTASTLNVAYLCHERCRSCMRILELQPSGVQQQYVYSASKQPWRFCVGGARRRAAEVHRRQGKARNRCLSHSNALALTAQVHPDA
jgi:hypothetical protein